MIDPALILEVIESFYAKATKDFLIGYHFRNIQDFETHIPRIAVFWEVQLNGSTERKEELPFNLISVHGPLGIKRGELGRWATLFAQTLQEHQDKLGPIIISKWNEKVEFFKNKLEQKLIRPS